jgi:hypothetical protein
MSTTIEMPSLKRARRAFKRGKSKPLLHGEDIWVNYALPPPVPGPELYYRRFFGAKDELRQMLEPFGTRFREFGTGIVAYLSARTIRS